MSEDNNNDDKLLYCSFCGKSQHEVKKLIAGPSVFICDECVELCNDIIREEMLDSAPDQEQKRLPSPQEINEALDIDPAVRLPDDSAARIAAASLLGGQYLEIVPGGAESYLEAGAVIYDTRDPVSLTDLLGKIVFAGADQGGS